MVVLCVTLNQTEAIDPETVIKVIRCSRSARSDCRRFMWYVTVVRPSCSPRRWKFQLAQARLRRGSRERSVWSTASFRW